MNYSMIYSTFVNLDSFFTFAALITGLAALYRKYLYTGSTKVPRPWGMDFLAGNFILMLGVFIFRSFIFESFLIPSMSMVPTLLVSDYIAVEKFSYGLKIPIVGHEFISFSSPKLGDVVVFKHPLTPDVDFIKRIVGTPGDTVSYLDKKLVINGEVVPVTMPGPYKNQLKDYISEIHTEQINGKKFQSLIDPDAPSSVFNPSDFKDKQNCQYLPNGFICKVPDHSYFMMGDNRDNSQDSRFWGFVPEENIKGKAVYIWVNPSDTSRIGSIV
jgi:signal peptidase I